MRAWWILIGSLAATPAVAADQFDLVCTAKNNVVHYRVDLGRSEWCQGDCSVIRKLASVTTGMLVLADEKPVNPNQYRESITINRNDGSWFSMGYFPRSTRMPVEDKGSCEPASFSGFPSPKF